jgi:hypothetical protein
MNSTLYKNHSSLQENRVMARKRDGINRSQAVRELLSTNPKMKAKEVVTTLAAKGIDIKPALVYFVKGQMKGKKGRRKAQPHGAAVAAMSSNGDALTTILRVKKLAEEVGGLRKLKALVEALSP